MRTFSTSYANQPPALAVVLALIGDLIDKMQVDNTAAFKIDHGFESKIQSRGTKYPEIEAPKRQQRGGSDLRSSRLRLDQRNINNGPLYFPIVDPSISLTR